MAQAGTFQFGVDESFLSQSVSRSLINGAKMAQKSGAFSPTVNDQAFRQPLGRITGDVNKFESSLSAANQRVIAFGASASVFYGVSTAIKGLLTSTVQVNKAMVDINAIFGLSANSLVKFKNELFDVSRKTSQSFDAVAESAKEFSRQGLSVSETLKRVRDSMILTRLTGLSAAEAANTLTAAVNSFNKSGLDTTQILNKMVAADSAFAVSSKDLADALTRVGSTAQDAGVQFDELLALVTSVKQITGREGAVIANGLKTIFNRVERSETLEMFDSLKIKIKDANSNILPTIEILKNLASQYDTLGVSGKQMVAEMVGGVYQINILKAAIGDLSKENSIYDQALRQVGKAQDEAIKRNEYLNTSFAAMIQQAQNTFSQIGSNLGEKIFTSNTNSLQSAIKDLFGKENFDNFLDGLKGVDAEGTGNTIGQGLIKGIGNVFGVSGGVPGPGLLALGIGVSKVLGTSLKMVMGDFNSLLGLNQKIQNINTGVERALIGANEAEKQRLATAKTLADQEKIILEILLRQNAAMAQMKTERAALKGDILAGNSAVAKAVGAQAILAAKSIPRAAGGLIPALAQESHSISKGIGGASPSAKPVLIPNFNFGGGKTGPIVANTDEYLVPNYAGRGSAIFNKEMVAKSGVPSGAIRVAAGGFSPINIENQFGRLFGELSNSGQFIVNGITTAQKGMGYSNKLYAELIGLLGEKGARSIFGKLVPQEAFDNPNIKAVLPQLTRGKHGRSNLLQMFGEDDQFGPSINFRGGNNFDTDLGNNAGRILRMMQQGYGATEFTTFLANGYVPNFANKFYRGITPSINKFTGNPLTPFDFSDTKGSLFASRDFGEAMSYADQQHKFVGEFSLKKGLKGLNLFSKSGRNKLAEIIEANLDKDDFSTSRMSPDKSKYEEIDVPISQILRNMKRDPNYNKSYFNKDDVRDTFRTLDRRSINNLLRSLNYDFVTFPDISGEGRQVNQNISILTESAITNKKWKNAYTQDQIDKLSDPYTIASGYIPNFARRGRPSIKGRQIRYEGDMDFSSVLGPEGLMQLFTIFGFGLGNHPTKSTIDRRALEKFGISIPEGLTPGSKFPYRGAAGGLLPKSLSDAIYREKKAGIPESSIYIDKDNRLISPQNPLGLLIANRRDEPAGGFQGVDRLQRIGLNPKLAGTTDVPNFAERPASELLLKYLTKGSDPKSILGNITYPGSTASMGEAQKSIEKYLGGIIKNISLKDVDFLSEGFVKQIQTKVKTAVESSFSGVNFGKSSIFGKITDQIIESREKEIRSLQNYQIALKQNEEIAKKATLEQNKRAIEEANAYTNYTLGKDRFFEGSSSGLASDYKVPTNEQIQQDRKRREQNAQKLYALQDQLTRNTINYKLSRGVRLENLSGVERSQYLSELQNKAISKLGLTSSGASAEQILANPQAQAQIDKYVRDQIRGLTQNATNRAISKITATAALNEKLASGSKFYQDLSGKEQTMLIKEFTRKAYSQYNFQGAGISYMQALRNTESRQLMDNYVQQEIAKMSRNQISTTQTAWQKWKDRMGSPIGQMAMMMGPSMISGFIPEGRGGTTSGRALGGVQGMLQGMGTGAMFGPWGAAIGAGVGGLMGVVSKWNKSFDEVAREIDEANTKNKKVVTDIGLYIQQTGEITEAVNEGLSPRRVRELVDKQIQLFSSFEDPNIRKDIISGRPEDALRKAQQNQLNRLNAGEVVSSFSRANEEVGFTRFLAKYPKLSSFALNPMFGSSINKISELTGSNIFERVGVGTLSQKNKEIASTSVLNIMDKFTESDLKKLSESINKDGITALENFKNQLNLTSGDIKQMSEDIPNKKEFLDIFNSAIEQRTKQLNIQKEFGGNIEDLMKRFQISNLQWQEVGFQTQLNANRVNIAGQSGLRTRNTLNTARIELNPNLTDVVRSEMLGEDQLANLQASNRLSLFGAAQSARVGLSTIAQESSIVGPDQILKMNEIFKSIADSGDLSSLEKEINNLTQLQKNAFDVAKDSKNNDKQFHGASVSYLREQYQKLDDLLRSSRAAEEELKIQTSVNTIRIKEGQRQNLMNNANYSVDIFAQARRNREAAEGLPFTRGPYRQGLMLQAKINEQDYLSSLGIVQSSESLNNYNALKQSRAQATIATLLQQETGQKVNPNDITALREASSRSANASRYKETIDLFGFNAQQEISKLSTGTGASYNEIVDKLMKSGADPLQSTIAMNTGKTAEVSTTINSNMVDGFSRIENLWQAAITSNKGAEVIKSAVGEKMGLYGEIGILKEERTKKLKANESTTDIDTKITELEQKYAVSSKKVDDLLNNRNKLISQNGSGTTTAISQLNQQTAAVNSEGSPVILEPFEVKESRDQKESIDEVTNSLRGLKQGLIDASSEWGTFAQLGEATGKTLVNAAGEGFGAFVVGSMNSTAAFRNFAASVISDIAKMYAQKAMTGLIGSLFGGSSPVKTANTGGSILKFAMGGKVPALLTGGEYYFTPSAAKAIGQNNLNAMNSGTARFAGGGLVRGGSGYMDDIPATLDSGGFVMKRSAVQKYGAGNLSALARNFGGEVRMYASGGNVSPAMGSFGSSSGASGNTNVKIELHDNRTSASATSDDSVNDPEFNKRLSIAIKSTVLNTVNEQRRIGGTLRQSSNY